MSHDVNGTAVGVGDLVMIPAKVVSIVATEDGKYCNLTVETVHPMPPYVTGTTVILNTRQVVLLGKGTFLKDADGG